MKKYISLLIFAVILIIWLILKPYNAQVDKEGINTSPEQNKAVESQIEPLERTLGVASWYDYDLNRKDQKCRSNDCYSMFHSTCASRDYERGTILTVRYKDKEVKCRVNDYIENMERDIDLSSYAFSQLAPLKLGLINVEIYENN